MQIAVQWRDPEVFRLCDLNTPNGGIDTNADPDCNTRSETPFQSLPQPDRPCQMQAQVSRDGLISMTDHIVGPTPYYLGNASTSKEMYGLRAEYGVDGKAWSSVHTGIEPQPWLQVQFDGGAKTVSTIIVHNRPDNCSARLFQVGTSCSWSYGDGVDPSTLAGFIVGVINTSCIADGNVSTDDNSCNGAGSTVCAHVTQPTLDGEGHEYVITCDPPVVGEYVYVILPHGERAWEGRAQSWILYIQDVEVRGPTAPLLARSNETKLALDSPGQFRVQWTNGSLLRVGDSDCSGSCAVHGTTCLCNVTATTAAVFVGNSIPTRAQIVAELRIGAFDPADFDNRTYVQCAVHLANVREPGGCRRVFAQHPLGAKGVAQRGHHLFCTVRDIGQGGAQVIQECAIRRSARGRQILLSQSQSAVARHPQSALKHSRRDVDAMLQHYTNHPTTPPFIARTLIQRMTTSNPSPRCVAAVATAFKTGVYQGIGDGARGDLAATTAAIVLDREAQSGELEHGANHGGLREPLLKVIHMLRALELETAADAAGQHQELCRAGGVQRRERFQLLSA